LIQGGQKTRKGGTRGEVMAVKQREEDVGKGSKTFIKGLKGGFATDGITEQHDHEINRVVGTKTGASKSDVLLHGCEQADMREYLGHHCYLSHPGWG
jgi:hypothetical protein